jgi:hypothetical protein
VENASSWNSNWAWALPLIVATVMLHVVGLALINKGVVRTLNRIKGHPKFFSMFVVVMGGTTLLATTLHAFEATVWAMSFRALGALPDGRIAMLYSLSAITTYGHSDLVVATHWRLMGALEALNGLLLFGLTTAFLYGHLQRLWPLESREHALPGNRSQEG